MVHRFTPNFHLEPPPQPPQAPEAPQPRRRRGNAAAEGGGVDLRPSKGTKVKGVPQRAALVPQPSFCVFFDKVRFFSLSAAPWIIYVWGYLCIGDVFYFVL